MSTEDADSRISEAALVSALEECGSPVPAGEAHGMLCGLACGGLAEPQAWFAQLGAARDPAPACTPLWTATVNALADDDLSFDLPLPDGAAPLNRRVAALGAWCSGFLSGLALAGVREADLDDDAAEALRDLAEIARVDAAVREGEESERALAELDEFVRVGVLLIREALAPGRGTAPTRSKR